MKEFRGTFMAIFMLAIVAGGYFFLKNENQSVPNLSTALFRFEKHDVHGVDIVQSNGTSIHLKEKEGVWFVEGKGWPADPSMINRIKHQLHDLDARTKVTIASNEPTRYGLGEHATRVSLHLDEGKTLVFLVGDPSPSAVSYYIQPLPGDVVYTVKKSAMDYFTNDISAFRDPRFARFDIKDAQEIQLISEQQTLRLQKTGVETWVLENPPLDVDYGEIRQILSKIAAVKAVRFIDEPESILDYGLSSPQLTIKVSVPNQELTILVGKTVAEGQSILNYMQIGDDKTIYVARFSLSEIQSMTPEQLRNKKICSVQESEILSIDGEIRKGSPLGVASVFFRAGAWSWSDGTLVSGSTPKRLATAISDLRALSFEESVREREPYGRLLYRTESKEQELWIGGIASEQKDEEGNLFQRYYAWIGENTYTIDSHLWHVLTDLIREQTRKNEEDSKTKALHERIEQ